VGIVVGGIGGGGDVGLAVVLVEDRGLGRSVEAVVSFARCSRRTAPPGLERVGGALYRVVPGARLGRRVFEDKLGAAVSWAGDVFIVCVESPWKELVEGFELLLNRYMIECMLHADIGGDALITGYEAGLGSYRVDTAARALLTYAAEKHGIRSILAVGAAGGEGGGGEIGLPDLAATLSLLSSEGAILGAFTPSRESLAPAWSLLRGAESGMLPLFLRSVMGARVARINMAYLRGEYEVKPWYRYVILVDTARACRASPICVHAIGRGVAGIKRWAARRQGLDRRVVRLYERMRSTLARSGPGPIEEAIMMIVEEHARRRAKALKLCE